METLRPGVAAHSIIDHQSRHRQQAKKDIRHQQRPHPSTQLAHKSRTVPFGAVEKQVSRHHKKQRHGNSSQLIDAHASKDVPDIERAEAAPPYRRTTGLHVHVYHYDAQRQRQSQTVYNPGIRHTILFDRFAILPFEGACL